MSKEKGNKRVDPDQKASIAHKINPTKISKVENRIFSPPLIVKKKIPITIGIAPKINKNAPSFSLIALKILINNSPVFFMATFHFIVSQ